MSKVSLPSTSVLSHDATAYPPAMFYYMTLLLLEPNRSTPPSPNTGQPRAAYRTGHTRPTGRACQGFERVA
jgi:hypothetical protein